MARLGHKPSGNAPGVGEMLAGRARATFLGNFTQNVWATKVGIRMGRNTGANGRAAPAFWNVNASNQPTTLFYSPAPKTISTYMPGNDPAAGSNYEWAVTNLPIASGLKLAGGPWADDGAGSIAYGQDNSGAMMYFDNSATSVPNPFGIDSASPQGKISVWIDAEVNRAPNMPEIVAPMANQIMIDNTPTIEVRFTDPDQVYGDKLTKFKIEVWDANNATRLQTSGVVNADGGMQSSGVASWTASSLAAGTYTIRANTYDHFGVASPTRTWKFTINAGGTATDQDIYPLDLAGTRPNGVRVANKARPGGLATWDHQDGAMALRYWIRIVNATTGAIVRSSVLIDNDKTDGEAFAFGFAGVWADLAAGSTLYAYEIQFEDEFNSLTSWVRGPAFEVNATPQMDLIGPSDEVSVTTWPILSAATYDPNDDTSSLTVTCEVRPVGGSPVSVQVVPSQDFDGLFYAQPDAASMPTLGSYEWRFTAADPWGSQVVSAWRTVHYVSPPALSVVTPTGTITTGTPFIDWTLDRTQTARRVRIWGEGTSILYWDSGLVATSTTSVTPPAGKLRNNVDYEGEVYVETADGLSAAQTFTFRVQYVPPAAMTGVTFETIASSIYDGAQPGLAAQEPNVRIAWTEVSTVTVPEADWIGYVVYREVNGEAIETLITDRSQTEFIDTTPLHGVAYDYHVAYRRYINAGADTIESVPVTETVSVTLHHTTITSLDPDGPAVTLHYWEDRSVPLMNDVVLIEVLGKEKRIPFQGVRNDERVEGSFIAIDDKSGANLFTAQDVVEQVKDLARPVRDSEDRPRPRQLFYRDPRGRGFMVVFANGVENVDSHRRDMSRISLTMDEVDDPRTIVRMS